MRPQQDACTSASADPGACLAVARERLERRDEPGAREYMEKAVVAINAAPACLRDHPAASCFAGVIVLLHEPPVGLLAPYTLPQGLLDIVPRWTGSEATGRRMQARLALHGMCVVPGRDVVDQQRACIVLADLVEDERMKRCGPTCDVTNPNAASGWSAADVIDGYATACKIDKSRVDRARQAAFAEDIARIYKVRGADASCAVAGSELRGASIPEALASMARIREEAKRRASATSKAADREAQRIAEMQKSSATNAVAVARAEDADFEKLALAAIAQADWPTTLALLTKRRGSPVGDPVASALQRVWDSFAGWMVMQSSATTAYLDLSSRLALTPPAHPVRQSLASLRERALVEARAAMRNTRGIGGTWLHAAILARVAGPTATTEKAAAAAALAKLVATTRVSLTIDRAHPACAPLLRAPPPGRAVVARATLACTLEPERKITTPEGVTARTFKVVVHGTLDITRGATARRIPIDVDVVVADTDGTDARTFDMVRSAASELIQKAVVGAIEAEDAQKALTAASQALKVGRTAAAEHHLVTHALLAGPSPELDEILARYGVAFGELMQP